MLHNITCYALNLGGGVTTISVDAIVICRRDYTMDCVM